MYAIIGFASICKPIERSIPLILCVNFTDSYISANKAQICYKIGIIPIFL